MHRSVLPLLAMLVAGLALEARAQTQVASLSGALPPEPEIGAFTAVNNTVERRYNDLAFALGEQGGRTYANEVVRALEASSAAIRLDDGTVLDVGPNSEITLDSFIYDPERGEQRLSLRFLSGIVRFTTGTMEKQAYEINTPVGSLTIRGTEFTLLMEEALHLVLNDGAITLSLFDGEEQDLDARDPDHRFLSVVDGAFTNVADTDGALRDAMNALEVTFDTPGVHSTVVGDYMTSFFNRVTLETCTSANLCLLAVERHFDRLCQIGVLRAEARRSLAKIMRYTDGKTTAFTAEGAVAELLKENYSEIRAVIDALPVTYGGARSCWKPNTQKGNTQVTRVSTSSGGKVKLRIDELGWENIKNYRPASPSTSRESGSNSYTTSTSISSRTPGASSGKDTGTPGKIYDPSPVYTQPIEINPIQIAPIQIIPIINPISPPTLTIGN